METNIGKIVKLHRIRKKFKQEYMAKKLGITTSTYSRFENNLFVLEDEQIEKAFSILEIDYVNEDISDEFEKAVYVFLKDTVIDKGFDISYKVVESYYEKIISTTSFPKYLFVEMYYKVRKKQKFDIKDYFFLEDYFEYLDSYHIQFYYDMVGIYHRQRELHTESVDYYLKAKTFVGNFLSSGMVCYHLSIAYRNLGKLSDALRYMEEAKVYFVKTLNLRRLVMAEFEIGLINQNMNNVEYGIQKYFDCLDAFKMLDMKPEVHNTYNSILWTYMKDGQYDNVLKIKDEALEAVNDDPYFYFMIAYTYYKMNDLKNAKQYSVHAKSLLHNCNDAFKINVIKALHVVLKTKDTCKKESALLKVYDSALECQDHEVIKFTLDWLCEFYKEEQDVENLNKYLMLAIEWHKKSE